MGFQEEVIYQAYIKSFNDSKGNGYGDIKGVKNKLAYLSKLGITMIWLNPFYPSPQNDNGYDISNYTAIDPVYGGMADFEALIKEAKTYGIKIMIDLVLNHSSTEHEWFQKALAGDKKYQDYYILREAAEGQEFPTNWQSKFGGPAWEKFGNTDKYYLSLFDKTQADLNWRNEEVREELAKVVRFWMDKGVKGFRLDVINLIGKDQNLKNSTGDITQEKSLYTDRPIVHEYLKELSKNSFGKDPEIITVGEMSSTSIEECIQYTKPESNELTMAFNFYHLKVDYLNGKKWTKVPFDFLELKKIINDWQIGLSENNGWNALFWNNHDQPRAVSRFGDDENYREKSATSQAHILHFLHGTPFVYQGEEIGMTNPYFEELNQYQDVESQNAYEIMKEEGKTHKEIMEILKEKSRDNSRTPMQWSGERNAGFTEGGPWIEPAKNYPEINVKNEVENGEIFSYYQKLIHLRKEKELIQLGAYEPILLEDEQIWAYRRIYKGEELITISNFYGEEANVTLSNEGLDGAWKYLIGNYGKREFTENLKLAPYESLSFIRKNK
ncbi:MAG: alpha,alpha-phosphotrehalase [Atopostipes suicloacalis]|nr:alpha,alpha-phosphotrehalase [Atopostipes suicloacalis]MDN6730773.1 alpha,alpha-phosphotrehalase [Atopostipes suicloacalis]